MTDTVIQNARIATAFDVYEGSIGITDGRITQIADTLPDAATTIDAKGKIITPGGVDSHCHIEQLSANGLVNADSFETATRSALIGGTTSVICFAAQHVGMRLREVVSDYHELAAKGAMTDYAFHLILTDSSAATLKDDLPPLAASGHASLKCFLTYDKLKMDDSQFIDILAAARVQGQMVCVHAENHGMIDWMGKRLIERGYTRPVYHAVSHPRWAEEEAINRAISMAALLDQPIMIFHVSTREGVDTIRRWQARGVKVFGETCTHYLTMTKAELDKPGTDGAMWVCSPPLRDPDDVEALWDALKDGTLTAISSDHAPYRMDETGKLSAGSNPTFKQMANGMGGLEARMPVLFTAMNCAQGGNLCEFVRLTATEPARIYNLAPNKGTICVGADADLVIWDPNASRQLSHDTIHDNTGYTAFDGFKTQGWPETVMRRGELVVADGQFNGAPGSGKFLARQGGDAAKPSGRPSPEFDKSRNFGAALD